MSISQKVPAALKEKFDAICQATDNFCDAQLNDEYKELIRCATAAICRKRPSPLQKGKENSWCAGVVHAIGMVNFLFDPSQAPHCKAPDIYAFFGVASSTGQAKSKEIRDMLGMYQSDPNWSLPSRLGQNPLVWMLEVNGLLVDVRRMPLEVQELAFQKGLIPYVPGKIET